MAEKIINRIKARRKSLGFIGLGVDFLSELNGRIKKTARGFLDLLKMLFLAGRKTGVALENGEGIEDTGEGIFKF